MRLRNTKLYETIDKFVIKKSAKAYRTIDSIDSFVALFQLVGNPRKQLNV